MQQAREKLLERTSRKSVDNHLSRPDSRCYFLQPVSSLSFKLSLHDTLYRVCVGTSATFCHTDIPAVFNR